MTASEIVDEIILSQPRLKDTPKEDLVIFLSPKIYKDLCNELGEKVTHYKGVKLAV